MARDSGGERRLPRSSFEARFEHFLTSLRREILSGERRPGELLDSESTLTRKYQLSLGSVRKGLQMLVNEGLIEKAHGRGTVVRYTGATARDVVKFAVYSPVIEGPAIRAIVQDFEAANPSLHVSIIRLARVGFDETLIDLVRSGDGPDLIFASNRAFAELAQSVPLLDLEAALGAEVRAWEFYPKVDQCFRVGGRLLAAPLVFAPVVLAYNQDLFDRAGIPYPDGTWTWHTLAETARALTKGGSAESPGQYGFGLSLQAHRWTVFLLQNEARIYPGAGAEERRRVLEAVGYAHRLLFRDRVAPLGDASTGMSQESRFAEGRVAMILTSYQALGELTNLPFRMDITVPPKGSTRATLLIAAGLAVNAASPRKEAALSLLRHFMRAESQRIIQAQTCSLPSRREICEGIPGIDLSGHPSRHPASYHLYRQVLPYAHTLDALGRWPHLQAFFSKLHPVWNNLATPEEGCRRAFDELERMGAAHATVTS